MESREQLLISWLKGLFAHSSEEFTLFLVSGDASFRSYYRVQMGQKSFIAVDAPPKKENSQKFTHVCGLLRNANVKAPEIFSSDYDQGFMLLEDFGDKTYQNTLEELRKEGDVDQINSLYESSINTLLDIQTRVDQERLDPYTGALLEQEMSLFEKWFCNAFLEIELDHFSLKIIIDTQIFLRNSAEAQFQVPVHRDYHSRNLMVLAPEIIGSRFVPGVIDFQDAVLGPYTYDLVSLLRDAYIRWDKQQVEVWALYYYRNARALGLMNTIDKAQFLRDFDLMGLQRQMKVIGIFARLAIRDNKPDYLADIPGVMRYFFEVSRGYDELRPFVSWFDEVVMPIAAAKINLIK